MSEDMSDLISKVKNMVDSGNIPDNLQEVIKNFSNSSTSREIHNSNIQVSNTHSGNSSNSSSTGNDFNIDIDTILKMKSIIDKINQKDDPRANLLYSLKPYLRDSKKNKLDQYVNLINMAKVFDVISNDKKETKNNGIE